MSSLLSFDPGFHDALEANGLQNFVGAPPLPIDDVQARRQRLQELSKRRSGAASIPANITITDHSTPSDGSEIRLRLYRPRVVHQTEGPSDSSSSSSTTISTPNSTTTTAAVIFVHGGGYISSTIDDYDVSVATYASSTSIPFLAVDYRLAPEHRYPTALNDVHASLKWLHSHADELNVDPNRIILMGSSAGAGLVAATAILVARSSTTTSRSSSSKKLGIAKQVLIAPMLDHRNVHSTTESDLALAPTPLSRLRSWNHVDNATGWRAYLGDELYDCPDSVVMETASPAQLQSAEGMPPLYIEVGGLDIFAQEDIRYAMNYVEAGIAVELHVYPGLPHSYDSLGAQAEVVQRAKGLRLRAIMSV